jgi:hypothetical protein
MAPARTVRSVLRWEGESKEVGGQGSKVEGLWLIANS